MSFLVSYKLFYLKPNFSEINIGTLALFLFTTCMEYHFAPFLFQLVCVFGFKWVSCRHHIDGSCFIHSAILCLLIGEFNTFTFKAITDKEGLPSVIMLFVFYVTYSFFVPHFSHSCLLLNLVDFFIVKYLNFFLISFCVYSIASFFVVPWRLHLTS